MAQNGFSGQALIQNGMNRLDVQQPFAAEAAGTEEVLIDVRNAAAIGVDAALAGKQPVVGRVLRRSWQWRHHARLQNAVAAHDATQCLVDAWRIERVGRHGDEFAQCARWQAGVAVQRDNIAYAIGKPKAVGQWRETLHAASREQAKQLFEFATLALPAQPALLGLAPTAWTMQQQESRWCACCSPISRIQCRQPRQRVLEHGDVAGEADAGCVNPVREQGKLCFALAVGEPVPFQALHQLMVGLRRA